MLLHEVDEIKNNYYQTKGVIKKKGKNVLIYFKSWKNFKLAIIPLIIILPEYSGCIFIELLILLEHSS